MTLLLLLSEFPYIWGKLAFLFYQWNKCPQGANSTVLYNMERIEAWLKERKSASAEREGWTERVRQASRIGNT
jgi:hypothetical protein